MSDEEGYRQADAVAERAVIAALLTSASAFDDVTDMLIPTDFGVRAYGDMYAAIQSCDASGRPVDVITVVDELRRANTLKRCGGPEAVAEIASEAGAVDNVVAHAEIVSGKAQLRDIVTAGRAMVTDAMSADADPVDVRGRAEQIVFDLGKTSAKSSMIGMAQAVPQLLAELAKTRNQLLIGHSTGLAELDRVTAGLQGGQLIIIAARPGVGKTSLALQIARHIAETTNMVVPFVSYEMSVNELTMRMLSAAIGLDSERIRQGNIGDESVRDIAVQAEKMAQVPLMLDDNPPIDIASLRSGMRRLARRTGIGAIVVDYIQLMSASRSKSGNRTEEVSEISRGLKQLARELDVPIIALSQLSRNSEQRPNKRPTLSDLRDSGAIEQDANTVIFVYRDSMYNPAADPELAELIIAKQRSGASGITLYTAFEAQCTRFKDTTKRPAANAPQNIGGQGVGWQPNRGGGQF